MYDFRKITLFVTIMALCLACAANELRGQTLPEPTSETIYALGASVNTGSVDRWAITGLMATPIKDTKNYAFAIGDGIPVLKIDADGRKILMLQGNFAVGIGREIARIRGLPIYVPLAAGISWTGENKGWEWTTGTMTKISTKYGDILPGVRVLKSSVSFDEGYKAIVSVLWRF